MIYFYKERGYGRFYWDIDKEAENIRKHGIGFMEAIEVFRDPGRQIYLDVKHSEQEQRLFCLGKVAGKVLTVRFTYRGENIRTFGAGYWRKGEIIYEKEKGL